MNLTGITTLLSIFLLVLVTPSLASRHRTKTTSRRQDCHKDKSRSDRPKKRHTDDAPFRVLTPGQPTAPPETCSDCQCLWTFYIDQDDNRIPREMFFANCTNSDCGAAAASDSCRKTYYTMTVLRRSSPSTDVWEMAEESVPTACVCRQPGR